MTSLSHLLAPLREQVIAVQGPVDESAPIMGITGDSRRVVPGGLFVAVEGFRTDGHRYLAQALEKGATVLVVQRLDEARQVCGERPVSIVQVRDSRRALALCSAAFFGFPAHALSMVGVTGTNGKTTTTVLVESILKAHGRSPGLIGTMYTRVGGVERPAANTTPESVDLQALLAEMRDVGHDSVVMEVSSHGLALDRVLGCAFDVAVFTNLTQDHLDFHGDMESYFQAKLGLFASLGRSVGTISTPVAVLNADDPWTPRIPAVLAPGVRMLTYGTSQDADIRAVDVEHRPQGVAFELKTPAGCVAMQLQLSGQFNVYNALAAAGAALALEVPLAVVAEALQEAPPVRGRFEAVRAGQDFLVVVDYAHTPDGLENVLRAAREITRGRVIVVFGCGGDRDRTKRPLMGALAAALADVAIVTSDNPRSEEPAAILRDITTGWPGSASAPIVVEDRREAIACALREARSGDAVVIAGKGHETYQIVGNRTLAFDDVEVARELLVQGLQRTHS